MQPTLRSQIAYEIPPSLSLLRLSVGGKMRETVKRAVIPAAAVGQRLKMGQNQFQYYLNTG